MPRIRMLALDVDGTLAARGDEVTPATRAAIHRVSGAGIEVVIATGRRFRSARRVIDRLGLEVATVCLGGALVKESDHRTLHRAPIEVSAIRTVIGVLRRAELSFVGQRDSHAHGGADFVVDRDAPLREPILRYVENNAAHAELRSGLAEQPPDDVLVIGTFAELGALERVARQLDAELPGRFVSTIVPSPQSGVHYLEVVGAEVSKWSALERLARLRGVAPEAVCAVGDEVNDLSMIHGSGLGIAMANGHERVRAAADWVCGRHDEDGLVAVVEHILGDA